MTLSTTKVALYIGYPRDIAEIQQQALDYCKMHHYTLTATYQDTEAT